MSEAGSLGTAVVCGATGYLGGQVVRAMHSAGYRVRALARDPARLDALGSAVDERFVGQATDRRSLCGLFDGARIAFSSIGIRHVRREPTFWQVDRDANLGLVELAEGAGVETFAFVSVFRGDELATRFPIAAAREAVVNALWRSRLRGIVLRPTGFFNDMGELFEMARRGRVWLPGDGSARLNPIDAADVASALLQLLADTDGPFTESALGGPDTFSLHEIGELAFHVLEKPARFASLPLGLVKAGARLFAPINANLSALLSGLALMSEHDVVAPAAGRRHLASHFERLRESKAAA